MKVKNLGQNMANTKADSVHIFRSTKYTSYKQLLRITSKYRFANYFNVVLVQHEVEMKNRHKLCYHFNCPLWSPSSLKIVTVLFVLFACNLLVTVIGLLCLLGHSHCDCTWCLFTISRSISSVYKSLQVFLLLNM